MDSQSPAIRTRSKSKEKGGIQLRPKKQGNIMDYFKKQQQMIEEAISGGAGGSSSNSKQQNNSLTQQSESSSSRSSSSSYSQSHSKKKNKSKHKKRKNCNRSRSRSQSKTKNNKKNNKKKDEEDIGINESDYEQEAEGGGEVLDTLAKLPKNPKQLQKKLHEVNQKLYQYKREFFKEQFELKQKQQSKVDSQAIPICGDVMDYDFQNLADKQQEIGGRLFDAIMIDPPWQLSTSQPSRGVAIAYSSLSDESIMKMPLQKLQQNGFIFVWTINAKYRFAIKLIEHWGYKLIDEITWVKKTVNGKIAKGHGFYLQHAKESCLIGVKGNVENIAKKNVACDVIFSERRGQSQKPEEIYEYVEKLLPNGFYLEIFGRRNNLRKNWVTVGNEI